VKQQQGEKGAEPVHCSNTTTIMLEVARAAYLDEILFGKANSKERFEIESAIEMALRMESAEDLVSYLNKHLATKMFLVGHNISCADVVTFLVVAEYFKELMDFQKVEMCHVFRWIDHIQHLPGLDELVNSLGLFVSFPDENNSTPSKSQLKKLAKIQAAKQKKEEKKDDKKEEKKEENKGNKEKEGKGKPAEEKKEGQAP